MRADLVSLCHFVEHGQDFRDLFARQAGASAEADR
jgi:hypothetical protein